MELDGEPAVLPSGVRNNKLQKTAPFVTSPTHEGVVGAAGQLEQLDAGGRIAPIGAVMIAHRLRDPVLFRPPLAGLALVEGDADLAVELVDIHLVEAVLELVVLGGEPRQRLVVEALLVAVALPERLRQEPLDVVVELKALEQLGELLGYGLLAGVLLRAAAFVAGAPVVDVAAFMGLTGHRAAAVAAADEPGEGEPVPPPLGSAGAAPVEHILDLLEELLRDDGLVGAGIDTALPGELAGVNPVSEDLVDGSGRDQVAALAEAEAGLAGQAAHILQRVFAGRIPLKELLDQGRTLGIGLDPMPAVFAGDVAVAER